jgi:UDP-N-acetylglucosamine/UDP-N-acetylgalactosamine diphosphorylase
MEKGVQIPNPHTVDIGEEVSLERISGDDVCFYGGTRIYGQTVLISRGVKLGYEAPVALEDCQLGPNVKLNGGFYKSSVFLDSASTGSGSQIREGCILEEEANTAHTVGLKQTILLPFVTLGSLINFCDCLMAGGTSRKNHSEVGSSYIHFNYTPNQDKATPSLIGDVPSGIMLSQSPIFLGGQGGLVGPARIGYGTVIAAGTVYRRDCSDGRRIAGGSDAASPEKDFHPGLYNDIKRKVRNNILYITNLLALKQWYIHVRQPFFKRQEQGVELYEGAMGKLDIAIGERLKRFRDFSEKMESSIKLGERLLPEDGRRTILAPQRELHANWPAMENLFTDGREADMGGKDRNDFLKSIDRALEKGSINYIQTIQGLRDHHVTAGTDWLRHIVDQMTNRVLDHIPSCKP